MDIALWFISLGAPGDIRCVSGGAMVECVDSMGGG
jgi:hypothetical protein